MVLSDYTLMYGDCDISVFPLNEENIQPASIDLNLAGPFLVPRRGVEASRLIEDKPIYDELPIINNDGEAVIKSHSFVLANTVQEIYIPENITAFVEGRSSVGRRGLFIQNAGWVDPGFQGHITLELYNASPEDLILTPGIRICQLVFVKMDRRCENPYDGKYQHQTTTTGSKMFKDAENKNKELFD